MNPTLVVRYPVSAQKVDYHTIERRGGTCSPRTVAGSTQPGQMDKRIIVGITAFNHDSSACIIANNQLLAFAEEERFTGVKHTGFFPARALEFCLEQAQCTIDDVTDVAFYFNPVACMKAYVFHNNPIAFSMHPTLLLRKRFYFELVWLLSFLTNVATLKRRIGNSAVNVHYIDHHLAHIWYGYYASGFQECVVLSNDSVGENVSTLATHFRSKDDGAFETVPLIEQVDPHSLGYLYGAVTEFLGFERGEGEGRVMALASYGTDTFHPFFTDNTVLHPHGRFTLKNRLVLMRSFQPKGQRLSHAFFKTFGNPRKKREPLTQHHYDIASGLQHALETIMHHQLAYVTQFSDRIVLVGGVAQNSVMNGLATNTYARHHFFIPPIPHDAGCSIGAAVYTYFQEEGKLPHPTDTAFLGPDYQTDDIIHLLENNKIRYCILDNPVDFIAHQLAENKVIGFFRSTMEGGPRALGHRSIFASPISAGMRDHLNFQVKYREPFRPYGGFILPCKVDMLLYHKNAFKEGPYMSYVYPVREEWKCKIPSLVHVDGTCRVQIIDEEDVFLQQLLLEFERITEVPLLINTSMNLKGYPIARSPAEALQTFYTSALDYLVLNERVLVEKEHV